MVDKNNIVQNFYKSLEEKGYKGKIVSAKHIPELRQDVRKHHEAKLLDPDFYEEYKSYFEFKPDVEFAEIKSLFIISVPQPQFEAIFHWNNKKISLLIPPTYLYGRKVTDQLTEFLNEILLINARSIIKIEIKNKKIILLIKNNVIVISIKNMNFERGFNLCIKEFSGK